MPPTRARPGAALRALDLTAVILDLGLTIDGASAAGSSGPVVFASSSEYDVALKWHRRLEAASAEARVLRQLGARLLSPPGAQYGNVLVLNRVRPGSSMRDSWTLHSRTPAPIDADLEYAGLVVAAIAKIPATDLTTPVESLLHGDVALALGSVASGGDLALPPGLVNSVVADLFSLEPLLGPPSLCHGDFHPGNLLSDGEAWLVIDPREVYGDPCADVGRMAASAALWARWDIADALEILCAAAGQDPQRSLVWTRAWLLQVFGYHWGRHATVGLEAQRCVDLLTKSLHNARRTTVVLG